MVKISTHTTSTKCQYRPTISTDSARDCGMRPFTDMITVESSMTMPRVTCTPWKPVRVKKAEEAALVVKPMPSLTNFWNSKTWPEMNTEPSTAVVTSQSRRRMWSPRWMAETAITMVSDDISSTNDEIEVSSMS